MADSIKLVPFIIAHCHLENHKKIEKCDFPLFKRILLCYYNVVLKTRL